MANGGRAECLVSRFSGGLEGHAPSLDLPHHTLNHLAKCPLLPALTTAGQSGCLSVACTHPSFLHLHFYPGHSFMLFSITFRKHIQASPGSVDIFQTPPMHSPDSLSPGPHLQVWITFAWSMPPSPCCQELCGLSLLGLDTY